MSWQYDEFEQVGTDYGSRAEVEIYDESHSSFRDMEAESLKVLDLLGIEAGDSIIDFGCGTGTFAIQAAQRCGKVHAVDVSREMLNRAEQKAVQAGVFNIAFHHAGFLTYVHTDKAVDAVATTFAFHHLPDFWKGIALKRLHAMLKPGGRFYMHDVIMDEADALNNIQALIEKLGKAGGKALREDTERHFKNEYSTYDWVIDGLLQRAGFAAQSKQIEEGVLGTYLCIRE